MFKVRFGRLSLDCLRPSSWSAANSCMSLECRKIYKCTDFEQFYWNLSNIVISFMFLECREIYMNSLIFTKFSENSQKQWIPVYLAVKYMNVLISNTFFEIPKISEFLYLSNGQKMPKSPPKILNLVSSCTFLALYLWVRNVQELTYQTFLPPSVSKLNPH